jgi:hypothetical protein
MAAMASVRRFRYHPAPLLRKTCIWFFVMRFVTVTPAGRRPYLEILANYLLRHRNGIAEHRWWLNTRVPEDVAYLYRLADRYPDFFKIVAKPIPPSERVGYVIWQYMSDCTEPDTIYLRLDDDICYLSGDAITQMRDFRLAHPEPFLVLGNIVNNAVCAHFHQQAGLLPKSWGSVANDCLDELGWRNGPFARRVHQKFLRDLAKGREERWKAASLPFEGLTRFSINAICWFGDDFRGIPELGSHEVDEEPFITAVMPSRLGRPNAVCSRALFAHYAFWPQRRYLDRAAPQVLARYRRLAAQAVPADVSLPLWEEAFLGARRLFGVSSWAAKQGASKAVGACRNGIRRIRRRAA